MLLAIFALAVSAPAAATGVKNHTYRTFSTVSIMSLGLESKIESRIW
jgi:hypothetical protein